MVLRRALWLGLVLLAGFSSAVAALEGSRLAVTSVAENGTPRPGGDGVLWVGRQQPQVANGVVVFDSFRNAPVLVPHGLYRWGGSRVTTIFDETTLLPEGRTVLRILGNYRVSRGAIVASVDNDDDMRRLVVWRNGVITVRLREEDLRPGTGVPFGRFNSVAAYLPDIAIRDPGGTLLELVTTGGVVEVASATTPVPGSVASGFGGIFDVAMNEQQLMFVAATLDAPSLGADGIYRFVGAALSRVADTNSEGPVPGSSLGNFTRVLVSEMK